MTKLNRKALKIYQSHATLTTNNFMKQFKISNIPPTKIAYNLCEVFTIAPPRVVVKQLLKHDIPRDRIIVSSKRRIIIYLPPKTIKGAPRPKKNPVVLVRLTPDEVDYLFSQGFLLMSAQPGTL